MDSFLNKATVALVEVAEGNYPGTPPYHPDQIYPEIAAKSRNPQVGVEENAIFRQVRVLFREYGMDSDAFGTPEWNPLGEHIQPGNTVILKPNLVSHRNLGQRRYGLTDTTSLVTQGSVIRAVAEFAAIALNGHGTLIIADCPIQGSRWDDVCKLTGLHEIKRHIESAYPGIAVSVHDFRLGRAELSGGVVTKRIIDESRRGDYYEVDIGKESLLIPQMGPGVFFGVAQYPKHRMIRAHTPDRNLYLFPKQIMDADVVINLPKMKSHQKAGITCALKNLVGINGHKDYLPHFIFGSPKTGGDEYPDGNWAWHLMWACYHRDWEYDSGLRKRAWIGLGRIFQVINEKILRGPPPSVGGGGWYGNETLWRTILDINRAFFYFDRDTKTVLSRPAKDRKYLAIMDGVIAGHKESPLAPTPIRTGLLGIAENPVAMDTVATHLMGFDPKKIQQVNHGFFTGNLCLARFTPSDVIIKGLEGIRNISDLAMSGLCKSFQSSSGFIGRVEADQSSSKASL